MILWAVEMQSLLLKFSSLSITDLSGLHGLVKRCLEDKLLCSLSGLRSQSVVLSAVRNTSFSHISLSLYSHAKNLVKDILMILRQSCTLELLSVFWMEIRGNKKDVNDCSIQI